MTTILISGGGRMGHLLVALLSQREDVQILWHTRRAAEIRRNMPQEGITMVSDGQALCSGRPAIVTDDITEVAGKADVIIFTQTANGRPEAVRRAASVIRRDRPVFIGAIPGCGGFDWLVGKEIGRDPNIVVWALRGVPATSPKMDTGRSVILGGFKDKLYLGFGQDVPLGLREEGAALVAHLFPQPTEMLSHFLEMTLSPLGFIHPSVLYARMGPYSQWDGKPFTEQVRWWADLTELAAYFLERCDAEQQRLIHAIEGALGLELKGAGTLHGKVVDQYRSLIADPRTMLSTFRTCSAFQSRIPMIEAQGGGYLFKMDHPGVREDLYYGMAFLLELGRRLGVEMPYMTEIYAWTVEFLGGPEASALEYLPEHWPPSRPIAQLRNEETTRFV
ncbi:NAD/NADP octopine/nopaline dehydrogenase family protein [Ensifer adhaerens]|uniref:NAD/NADP octopine/nopaline dehydrogenase family protein n=1 Tax=Ensifer adhaerens TaxID=106592 RepID=UPI000CF16E1D|nr:NAD/NADP octopine/nopaline dehydrogenase family protein [Ensifer adhaerens]